jgi:osmotically-inducible protein OsmY
MTYRILISFLLVVAMSAASGCVIVVAEEGIDSGWAGDYDDEWGERIHSHDRQVNTSVLADDVVTRLRSDYTVGESDIRVAERDGVVTLHGRVDDVRVVERALEIAEATPGVEAVISRLVIDRRVK